MKNGNTFLVKNQTGYKNKDDCLFRIGNGIAIGKFLFDY